MYPLKWGVTWWVFLCYLQLLYNIPILRSEVKSSDIQKKCSFSQIIISRRKCFHFQNKKLRWFKWINYVDPGCPNVIFLQPLLMDVQIIICGHIVILFLYDEILWVGVCAVFCEKQWEPKTSSTSGRQFQYLVNTSAVVPLSATITAQQHCTDHSVIIQYMYVTLHLHTIIHTAAILDS